MKVGDSFLLKGNGNDVSALRSAAKTRSKSAGEKYTVQKNSKGARCWRVA